MTLDLPTPPLPEEISSGRVFEVFFENGISRPFGVAVGLARAGGRPGVAVQRAAEVLAILVAHHGELEVDRLDAVELRGGLGHPPLDLALERTARHGEGDEHADDAVVADRHPAQHAEVDDRAVQFGILDRAEGVDDLFFGHDGGHDAIVATGRRICTEFALRG